MNYSNKYGEIVHVKLGPKRSLLVISEYEFLEMILSSNQILQKSLDYKNINRWLGTGLLTGHGPKWKRHRHILTPTFHNRMFDEFIEIFERNTHILIKKIEEKAKNNVNVYDLVTLCTLDIICGKITKLLPPVMSHTKGRSHKRSAHAQFLNKNYYT